MTTQTKVYEVKIGRKWSKVRATGMIALSNWANANGIKDFRMVGMMSITETIESQSLNVVA